MIWWPLKGTAYCSIRLRFAQTTMICSSPPAKPVFTDTGVALRIVMEQQCAAREDWVHCRRSVRSAQIAIRSPGRGRFAFAGLRWKQAYAGLEYLELEYSNYCKKTR